MAQFLAAANTKEGKSARRRTRTGYERARQAHRRLGTLPVGTVIAG